MHIEKNKSELLADDGVSKLIKKLDDLFLIDKNRRAFLAYQDFDKFRRPSAMSISDFLNMFDRKYFDFTEHGMSLPDAVLAFRLLDNANISEADFRLAMTPLIILLSRI